MNEREGVARVRSAEKSQEGTKGGLPPASELAGAAGRWGSVLPPPRLRCVDRQQVLPARTLEELLEPDHPARKVWAYVQALDLSVLYDRIRSRLGGPGDFATDPRILVALWLYATLRSVTSARELDELCRQHHAYRWLAGGVSLNYHTLSDFRTAHPDFLENLLTHSVEVLRQQGLVPLDLVAQDGMRVRASAGAASFHREQTLQRQLEQAQVEARRLQETLGLPPRPATSLEDHPPEVVVEEGDRSEDSGPPEGTPRLSRPQAAQFRSARERAQRARQALERLPEMEAKKEPQQQEEARVSSTDPEATVMKMADGGYRPAYNIHYSTDCHKQVIVGVEVLKTGSDQGQVKPMLEQIESRLAARPKNAAVDGGFVKLEEIAAVERGKDGKAGTTLYMPVPKPKNDKRDPHKPLPGDAQEVGQWRVRMGTEQAKAIYRLRGQTAECVNAQARHRGLIRLLVRGLQKVKSVALWFAATHNMARFFSLSPQPPPHELTVPLLT